MAIRDAGALSVPRFLARPIGETGLLVAVVLGVGLVGWRSWASLLPYLSSSTPLSFVPLVPVFGAVFLILRFDSAEVRARSHDPFIDGVFFLLLALGAGIMLLLLPVTMGWDYWLDRLDVPALILLLSALLVAIWGVPVFLRLVAPLGYLLLGWPWPWLVLDNRILTPLTALTGRVSGLAAALLPLGIRPAPESDVALLVPHAGQVTTLVIAQACSGSDGSIGLAVLGLPLALLARGRVAGRGRWEARFLWLVTGMVLAWAGNVIRIVVIAVSAALWGHTLTFQLLHPVVGLVLFAATFVLFLAAAPLFGLDLDPVWTASRPSAAGGTSIGVRRGALLLGILLIGGAAELNMGQFVWLSESALPRVALANAGDLFRPPPGWRTASLGAIASWTPFFGASSIAAVSTIEPSAGNPRRTPPVDVQAILSRDAGSFDAYSVENCYTFHGYHLQAVRRIALGNGVTASLIDYRVGRRPTATLYWIQPVLTPRGEYHQRIVLIAGDNGRVHLGTLTPAAPGVVGPVQQLSNSLADFLSPWIGGDAGPEYAAANTELQRLGQAVVDRERHVSAAGGPIAMKAPRTMPAISV